MSSEAHSNDLIVKTKLFRPRLGSGFVDRGRLLDLMNQAGEKPLTLVSAPAGYGKSVLVSQWVEQVAGSAAWLSLDQDDSDLGTFLAYLLASLDTVVPGSGRATANLLEAPVLPPVRTVFEHLVKDFEAIEETCSLVLDDYHRIDPVSTVHELLDRLLANPPGGLRIILVTRKDPSLNLKRLRAGGQVAEVRMGDLRFTRPETFDFLVGNSQVNVGDMALEKLQSEIEGWAAGLRLVSLALPHAKDPEAFLCEMHGGLAHTREYLLKEVLESMPADVRRYLLVSSILDRFCSEVLDSLLIPEAAGEVGIGGGEEFLQLLKETNLFIIDLDSGGNWYRYHHLFQVLLLQELHRMVGGPVISEHYMRASRWFESSGFIGEALQYALSAENVAHATQLVVRNRQSAVNDDRWYSLEKWLALLPEPVIQGNAELLMARTWVLMHNVRFEVVLQLADQIESMLDEGENQDHLRGEIALFRGYVLYFLGDAATSLQFIEYAQANIPATFFEARAQAEVINALALQMEGRKDQALLGLDDLLANYDSPQELRKTRLVVTYVFLYYIAGDLPASDKSNRRLREITERGGYAYAATWSVYMQGLANLQRYQMDDASDQLEYTVSHRHIHFKRAAADSIVALMLTQQVVGKPDSALKTFQLLRDYVASQNDPALWALVGSAEARLAIQAGRDDVVADWLAGIDLPPEGAMLWWLEVPSVTHCRALIAAGSTSQVKEARERLRELTLVCEGHHNITHLIEILVLRTVVCERQGRRDDALDHLTRAVELARPGGIIFPFVEVGSSVRALFSQLAAEVGDDDFVACILAALDHSAGSAGENLPAPTEVTSTSDVAPQLLDELTARELEVLGLLENRLQDKEIAAHLEISIHTVKHHLKQVYHKLDVHSRQQAVRRAVENGILRKEAAD